MENGKRTKPSDLEENKLASRTDSNPFGGIGSSGMVFTRDPHLKIIPSVEAMKQ